MMEYEILYLVGESKKAQLDTIKKSVEDAIVAAGGEMQEGEFVDERRMEYLIKGESRGTYIAKRFTVKEGAGDIPAEVTKTISFDKNILRFMVVRAEELPTLEESQERVRHTPDTRRKPQGRYISSRQRPPQSVAPAVVKPESAAPALSDTEIDKKLGEVLDI
ncbi:MAG: 30S ribosomal protein S6 [Candidatus Moraniibacteriota bacterium]